MRTKTIMAAIAITTLAFVAVACKNDQSSAGNKNEQSTNANRAARTTESEKVINSTKVGDFTVTLASATGDLKSGENELMLSFADASGKPVDVGSASLRFHMPAMGTMAEMNDVATVTPTATPGKYRANVKIEIAGPWEAIISYEGSRGSGQASMSVTAK